MGRVLVAGSINMDIVATAPRHPRIGETLMGDAVDHFPGGKGSNQAVAAARSGVPTSLVAVVGQDEDGERLRDFLIESGVSDAHVRTASDSPSGTAIIVVAGGENAVVVVSGANALLGPSDVERVPIKPDDVLLSQFETKEETILAFFERGKSAGARTLLNPSPQRECSDRLLGLSDVIVVNELELEQYSASLGIDGDVTDVLEALGRIAQRRDQAVVVTLGGRGCLVARGGATTHVAGRPVKAIDTTGAGDCFLGNIAGQLVRGAALEAAAALANVAASICVTRMGAGSSMPTEHEIARAALRG
jgi:ribokinase